MGDLLLGQADGQVKLHQQHVDGRFAMVGVSDELLPLRIRAGMVDEGCLPEGGPDGLQGRDGSRLRSGMQRQDGQKERENDSFHGNGHWSSSSTKV